eukprot:3447014-Rhodomonas_salina.1
MPPPLPEALLPRTVSLSPTNSTSNPCAKMPPPSLARLREIRILPARLAVVRALSARAPPTPPATHSSNQESLAVSAASPSASMPPPSLPATHPLISTPSLKSTTVDMVAKIPPPSTPASLPTKDTFPAALSILPVMMWTPPPSLPATHPLISTPSSRTTTLLVLP